MAKDYKVTLQDETVYEVKKILNIGTKMDGDRGAVAQIKPEQGKLAMEDYLEYPYIQALGGDVDVQIEEGISGTTIMENGRHVAVTIETTEEPVPWSEVPSKVKHYKGTEYITVAIPSEKFITSDNLGADLNTATGHENDILFVTAANTAPEYEYSEVKSYGVNVWADEAKLDKNLSKLNVNVTKGECIAHYKIDEVENYTHLAELGLYSARKGAGDEIIFNVSGKIRTEDGKKVYPMDDGQPFEAHTNGVTIENDHHVLTECLHITVTELNALLESIGYTVVEK